MYPYPQQIGLSHSFLIIKAPHLSFCWWHHKLFVVVVICDPDNINVETPDTLVGEGLENWWWWWWGRGVIKSSGIKCLARLQRCPWFMDVICGIELHVDYVLVGSGASSSLDPPLRVLSLLMESELNVTATCICSCLMWVMIDRESDTQVHLNHISSPFFSPPSLSPAPEQGREFSPPWSSARWRALKTITREQVKQQTTQNTINLKLLICKLTIFKLCKWAFGVNICWKVFPELLWLYKQATTTKKGPILSRASDCTKC